MTLELTAKDAEHAHAIVNKALRSGDLRREPCEVCGASDAQAHHDDYAKPLSVRWLCAKHHREHHREHRSSIDWANTNEARLFHVDLTEPMWCWVCEQSEELRITPEEYLSILIANDMKEPK